ncbi:MAG: hypothetical protein IJI33_01815 [Solobacterium sp.]|nr:hypothetical protein [Solobacterium sp.]
MNIRKRVIIKGGACLICAVLIAALNYIGLTIRLNDMLDLRSTCIAARDIKPRSLITEKDILEIKVPGAYLLEHTCSDKKDIVGKYTDIQGMIPAGSCFFEEMLYDEKDLPDYPSTQLRAGQAAYTLETDLARMGGTIMPGQRLDLYVVLDRKNDTPVSGCLLQNVRLLAVKDHKGLDLTDENSTGIPYLAVLAVSQKDVELLSLAEKTGEIRMFSTDNTYSTAREAELVVSDDVLQMLKSGTGEHM